MLSKTDKRSRLKVKSIGTNNRFYRDGLQFCELFNKYFSSVSTKNHKTIPSPTSEDDFSYCLRNIQLRTTFSFPTIQLTEVESTILSLKKNKTHISTYHYRMLKNISSLYPHC